MLELTGGHGAEAVIDFVGEGGATAEGVAMLRQAGNYYVVGYGENISVPTIDMVSAEINIIGNLVGSYNDLRTSWPSRRGAPSRLHTQKYALDDFHRRSTTWTPATSAAARSSPPLTAGTVRLRRVVRMRCVSATCLGRRWPAHDRPLCCPAV